VKKHKLSDVRVVGVALQILALSCSSSLKAAPAVSVGPSSAAPGGSGTSLVYLVGNTSGVALQFDLVFDPSRVVAAGVMSDPSNLTHVVVSGQPTNGVLRVVLYSLNNALLNSSALVDLQVAIAPGAAEGPLALLVTNAILADATGSGVAPVSLLPGTLTISAGAGSRLTLLGRFVGGQVQLQLTGPANKKYILQSSPDLATWINISTNILTDGQITLSDSPPPASSKRYYRANYAP
jgi:hypothetical protein